MGDCGGGARAGAEEESLEARQRREKKELQGQVQALKKTVKGDKSKKKEVAQEIARLEFDLEEKHRKELDEPSSTDIEESSVLDAVEAEETPTEKPSAGRVSKAQKRREKKAQEERERNERIKQQEKENLHGPRNMETLAITAKLKEKALSVYSIPSDGDCLFKAISHQLELTNGKIYTVQELRTAASKYIRENKDDFLPFMSNLQTFEMLNDEEFDEYCNSIENTKTWGGQLEIRALSNTIKCPIHVIQGMEQETVRQGDEFGGAPLILTYHRHMYSLGEHYNSTQKVIAES